MRDLCGDGNVLHLGCINVNIQVLLILYYNFAGGYHWRKLVKDKLH